MPVRFRLMTNPYMTPVCPDKPDESHEIIIEFQRGDAYQIYRERVLDPVDPSDIRREFGRALQRIGKRIEARAGDGLRWSEADQFEIRTPQTEGDP